MYTTLLLLALTLPCRDHMIASNMLSAPELYHVYDVSRYQYIQKKINVVPEVQHDAVPFTKMILSLLLLRVRVLLYATCEPL